MPLPTVHEDLLNQYIISMLFRQVFTPLQQQTLEQWQRQNMLDIQILLQILLTRYIRKTLLE